MFGYRFDRYETSAEALNMRDSKADDIACYYPYQLPALNGHPAQTAPVTDFVIHPVEPIELRTSLTAHF